MSKSQYKLWSNARALERANWGSEVVQVEAWNAALSRVLRLIEHNIHGNPNHVYTPAGLAAVLRSEINEMLEEE